MTIYYIMRLHTDSIRISSKIKIIIVLIDRLLNIIIVALSMLALRFRRKYLAGIAPTFNLKIASCRFVCPVISRKD